MKGREEGRGKEGEGKGLKVPLNTNQTKKKMTIN